MIPGMTGLFAKMGGVGRTLVGTVGLAALLGVAMLGYTVARNDLAAEVYRDRLAALAHEYESLRGRYNEVVRRAAVTELIVEDGALSVRVVGPDGRERIVPTPLDPRGEIYVDFVVLDGRLWIRRLFDARTSPSDGLVLDPRLATLGWVDGIDEGESVLSEEAGATPLHARVGKAVYRRLEEGRWIVTVTGNGSLGLERARDGEPARLLAAPQVRDYRSIEQEVQARLDRVGPLETIGRLVGLEDESP